MSGDRCVAGTVVVPGELVKWACGRQRKFDDFGLTSRWGNSTLRFLLCATRFWYGRG